MRLRVACHCSQKLPPTKKDQRKKTSVRPSMSRELKGRKPMDLESK